jgi:hypothetical protein
VYPLFIFIHSLFISFSQICLPPVALVFSANFDYVLIIEPKAISERSPDFWNGFFDKFFFLISPFHLSLELVSA